MDLRSMYNIHEYVNPIQKAYRVALDKHSATHQEGIHRGFWTGYLHGLAYPLNEDPYDTVMYFKNYLKGEIDLEGGEHHV